MLTALRCYTVARVAGSPPVARPDKSARWVNPFGRLVAPNHWVWSNLTAISSRNTLIITPSHPGSMPCCAPTRSPKLTLVKFCVNICELGGRRGGVIRHA